MSSTPGGHAADPIQATIDRQWAEVDAIVETLGFIHRREADASEALSATYMAILRRLPLSRQRCVQ